MFPTHPRIHFFLQEVKWGSPEQSIHLLLQRCLSPFLEPTVGHYSKSLTSLGLACTVLWFLKNTYISRTPSQPFLAQLIVSTMALDLPKPKSNALKKNWKGSLRNTCCAATGFHNISFSHVAVGFKKILQRAGMQKKVVCSLWLMLFVSLLYLIMSHVYAHFLTVLWLNTVFYYVLLWNVCI